MCTPWRVALLTGQYRLTNDVWIPTDRPIFGILHDAGHDTAYIGKWHLDGNRRGAFRPHGPRRQGFPALVDPTVRTSTTPRGADRHGGRLHRLAARGRAVRRGALVGPPHNTYRDLPREYLGRYPVAVVEVPANYPDPVREDLAGCCVYVTALDRSVES